MARLKLGNLSPDEARAEFTALGDALTPEQRAQAEGMLFEMEVSKGLQEAGRNPQKLAAAGEGFLKHHQAGRAPRGRMAIGFYVAIIEHAKAEKDVEVFKQALAELNKRLANNPRAKGFLEGMTKELEKLQSEAGAPQEGSAPKEGKERF